MASKNAAYYRRTYTVTGRKPPQREFDGPRREHFLGTTDGGLRAIERHFSRLFRRLPFQVRDFGSAYLVEFEDSYAVSSTVLSAIINTIRRAEMVGIITWRKVDEEEPVSIQLNTKIKLAPDFFALTGCILYKFHHGGYIKRALLTDCYSELLDLENIFIYGNKLTIINEFKSVQESKKSINKNQTLSDLFKEYTIGADQMPGLIEAIGQMLERTRIEGVPPMLPPKRRLDAQTTQWPQEKYEGKRATGEDIISFLRRVWKPLIERGATRLDLKREDPQAYMAVANLTRVRPDGTRGQLPADIHLPTQKEVNDALLALDAYRPADNRNLKHSRYRRRT